MLTLDERSVFGQDITFPSLFFFFFISRYHNEGQFFTSKQSLEASILIALMQEYQAPHTSTLASSFRHRHFGLEAPATERSDDH